MNDDADRTLWRVLRGLLLFLAGGVSAFNEIGIPGS
jgi:hypothetical protein